MSASKGLVDKTVAATKARILDRVAKSAGSSLRPGAGAKSPGATAFERQLPEDQALAHDLRSLWASLEQLAARKPAALQTVPSQFVADPVINFKSYHAFAERLKARALASPALYRQWRGDVVKRLEADKSSEKLRKELAALKDGEKPSERQLAELRKLLGPAVTASALQQRFVGAVSAWQDALRRAEAEDKKDAKIALPQHVEIALVNALVPVERALAQAAAEANVLRETSAARIAELKANAATLSDDIANLETLSVDDEGKRHPEWEADADRRIANHDWNLVRDEVDKDAKHHDHHDDDHAAGGHGKPAAH